MQGFCLAHIVGVVVESRPGWHCNAVSASGQIFSRRQIFERKTYNKEEIWPAPNSTEASGAMIRVPCKGHETSGLHQFDVTVQQISSLTLYCMAIVVFEQCIRQLNKTNDRMFPFYSIVSIC